MSGNKRDIKSFPPISPVYDTKTEPTSPNYDNIPSNEVLSFLENNNLSSLKATFIKQKITKYKHIPFLHLVKDNEKQTFIDSWKILLGDRKHSIIIKLYDAINNNENDIFRNESNNIVEMGPRSSSASSLCLILDRNDRSSIIQLSKQLLYTQDKLKSFPSLITDVDNSKLQLMDEVKKTSEIMIQLIEMRRDKLLKIIENNAKNEVVKIQESKNELISELNTLQQTKKDLNKCLRYTNSMDVTEIIDELDSKDMNNDEFNVNDTINNVLDSIQDKWIYSSNLFKGLRVNFTKSKFKGYVSNQLSIPELCITCKLKCEAQEAKINFNWEFSSEMNGFTQQLCIAKCITDDNKDGSSDELSGKQYIIDVDSSLKSCEVNYIDIYTTIGVSEQYICCLKYIFNDNDFISSNCKFKYNVDVLKELTELSSTKEDKTVIFSWKNIFNSENDNITQELVMLSKVELILDETNTDTKTNDDEKETKDEGNNGDGSSPSPNINILKKTVKLEAKMNEYRITFDDIVRDLDRMNSYDAYIINKIGNKITFNSNLIQFNVKETELVYNGIDFNDDGIIHYIGTNYGKSEVFISPYPKQIRVRCPNLQRGTLDGFINYKCEQSNYTKNGSYSYFTIDFKNVLILPYHYSLRHDGCDGWFLRSWNFEGQILDINNKPKWEIILSHKDDESLNDGAHCTHTWKVNTKQFYKKFRIFMTAKNANGSWSLNCCGFEIYGELKV